MGQEILYCGVCQTQLRGSDFEKGRAVRVGREAWCRRCVPPERAAEAARTPPAETPKRGSQRIPLAPPPPETPKRGSQRIPLVDARAPRPRPARSGSPALAIGLSFGVGALAVVLLVALASSKPAPPPPPKAPPPEVVAPPPPPPPQGPTPREERALAALKAARAARSEEAFARAVEEARGTPLESDARRGLDELRAERRRELDAAAAESDARLRALLSAEDFARASRDFPSRQTEILEAARQAFAPLREKALDARRRGAAEEVEKLRARVAAWSVGSFAADLNRELAAADAPPPDPAPAPAPAPDPRPALSADALNAARAAAFERAAGRLFTEALGALPAEAGEDVELLKAAAAVHEEALKTLARAPKGRKIALSSMNYDRVISRTEGSFVRLHDHHVELLKGKSLQAIQWGDVLPRSFADWLPAKERRAVAAACLIEGDDTGALEILKDDKSALPARWWEWAIDFRRRHGEGPLAERERSVSYRYYDAWLRSPSPAERAASALAAAKIAREHRDLAWVGRRLPLLESRVDSARDYLAGPELLRASGAFRLDVDRERAYWESTSDGERRRDSFVEMDFSTLPGTAYRAWAYVGACCAETARVWAGGSGIPEDAPALNHGFLAATKTHASHGGKRRPERWGWIELPPPAADGAGPKTLRLSPAQAGFSVAWMLVSATREKPLSEAELKERDKELPRGPGPLGPTLGLAAWFRGDAVQAEGGRVSRWGDVSGRQRHASAADPASRPLYAAQAINGRPALRFDGERSALAFEAPIGGFSAMTIVCVAQAAKDLPAAAADMDKCGLLQWRDAGPGGSTYLFPARNGVTWRFGTAQWGNLPHWRRPNNESAAGPLLVTARKDGPVEELFVQGVRVAELSDRWRPTAHVADQALIGAAQDPRGETRHWAGDAGEILVFSRALPEAERLAVEAYLKSRFGL